MRVPVIWRIHPRRLVAALLGVLLLAGITACGTSKPDSANGAAPTTLTLATGFAIDDLEPLENGFWGNEFGYSELLMRPQIAGAPTPWLLEKVENVDPTTWVLSIQPKARFQNGAPLDGAALADVMNYSLQNVASLKPLAGTSVVATAAHEVTVTTAGPIPNLPYLLADESKFVIFDLAAYNAANGDAAKLVDAMIYTGPYVATALTSQQLTMKADPDYWGGTPPLESVTVKFIEEAQSRILAVQNDEADFALYPPTDAAKTIEGRTDSYWVKGTPKGPTFQFQMNQKSGPFVDPSVRKAVLSAIDYQEIAKDVMNGLYEVSDSMYAPSAPYHHKMFGTDVDAATKLLTAAGWAKGSDGKLAKDGAPLTIHVLTYPQQPDSDTLALAVQSELAKIGITVEIQQVPDTEEAKADPSITWDAAIEGNGSTSFSGDPTTSLQSYFRSDGPRNAGGISDPQLDALIDQYATTMDEAARNDILVQIQERIADNAYMGWLGMRIPGIVVSPAWKGYKVLTANLWVDAQTKP